MLIHLAHVESLIWFLLLLLLLLEIFFFLHCLLSVEFFIPLGWSRITPKNGSFTVNFFLFSFTGADDSKKNRRQTEENESESDAMRKCRGKGRTFWPSSFKSSHVFLMYRFWGIYSIISWILIKLKKTKQNISLGRVWFGTTRQVSWDNQPGRHHDLHDPLFFWLTSLKITVPQGYLCDPIVPGESVQ